MTPSVKKTQPVKKRSYSSAVREENAAQTRVRILEAAGDLFASNGYARTTIRGIADRASVAGDTAYAAFCNKARGLTALIGPCLAPAGGPGNMRGRPGAKAGGGG